MVTESQTKNQENEISYSQIKNIENTSCIEISENFNLLFTHIILRKILHISRC